MNTLRDLTSAATAFRDARDWKQFHGFKEMFISLELEASELLEQSQWETGAELDRKKYETKRKPSRTSFRTFSTGCFS